MPAATSSPRPRLIIADDNIRDIGGHFFELATLLLRGGTQLGYQGILATNQSFNEQQAVDPSITLLPTFQTRRLVHWSMGVDGNSKWQRDIAGNQIGGPHLQKQWSNLKDRLRPKKCPQTMLAQWSDDLAGLINKAKPTPNDTLLINTGDDFALLALAAAMQKVETPPLRIDVIFHFALYESAQTDRKERLREIGRQLRASLKSLSKHDIHLHATTRKLASQLRETECGHHITAVPYPTRPRKVCVGRPTEPYKAVLAGLPRAEKGRAAIVDLLSAIEGTHLKNGRYQVSMQMPAQRWQSMIPPTLHRTYTRAVEGSTKEPLEVMTSNLTTEQYHQWLDTADIGLFLYDADRYVARCSGVLLEMMIRGVPVIVPDGCWLADQVRVAGGHRSIGFIYQDRSEIPDLMSQFIRHRDRIRSRCVEHAAEIAKRHDGANTLIKMGHAPLEAAKVA